MTQHRSNLSLFLNNNHTSLDDNPCTPDDNDTPPALPQKPDVNKDPLPPLMAGGSLMEEDIPPPLPSGVNKSKGGMMSNTRASPGMSAGTVSQKCRYKKGGVSLAWSRG